MAAATCTCGQLSLRTTCKSRAPASHAVQAPSRGLRLLVRAEQGDVSRRQTLAAGTAALAALAAAPARAFLGFGGPSVQEVYQNETATIIQEVLDAVNLPADDDRKEAAVTTVRKSTNQWVAKYRRNSAVQGKQSFSLMYSALNALAGHFNSFGPTAPIPKKRLERVLKEVNDSKTLLSRGR